MSHKQGGWPDEIDPQEVADVTRYMKKMNRDATLGFAQASIDMVLTENFLIVAFKRRTGDVTTQELSVAELYHSRMEMDTAKMLKDHVFGA